MNTQPATLATPETPEEKAQVEYGQHLIWRLVGSKVTSFGANEQGEIYMAFLDPRTGKPIEIVIGKDERGDVAVFELEKGPAA